MIINCKFCTRYHNSDSYEIVPTFDRLYTIIDNVIENDIYLELVFNNDYFFAWNETMIYTPPWNQDDGN